MAVCSSSCDCPCHRKMRSFHATLRISHHGVDSSMGLSPLALVYSSNSDQLLRVKSSAVTLCEDVM